MIYEIDIEHQIATELYAEWFDHGDQEFTTESAQSHFRRQAIDILRNCPSDPAVALACERYAEWHAGERDDVPERAQPFLYYLNNARNRETTEQFELF